MNNYSKKPKIYKALSFSDYYAYITIYLPICLVMRLDL